MFILFKKTGFNTILACLGVRCIGDGGRGHNFFVAEIGGRIWSALVLSGGTQIIF